MPQCIRVTSERHGDNFPQARAELADALDTTFRSALAYVAEYSRTDDEIEVGAGRESAARNQAADLRIRLERTTGFEPATPTLARLCSTN